MCREHRDRLIVRPRWGVRGGRQCSLHREPAKKRRHKTIGSPWIPSNVCYQAAVVWSDYDIQRARRISASRERAVVCDILTEKHRPSKSPSEVLLGQDTSGSLEQDVFG